MTRNSYMGRREFLTGLGVATAAAAASLPSHALTMAMQPRGLVDAFIGDQQKTAQAQALSSPFRVAVINDEISQDFGHACEVASQEFGMHWIELRGMWKKNILKLDEMKSRKHAAFSRNINCKVTDIASPLFKVDWPGAPKSKFSEPGEFRQRLHLQQQDEVLERAMELAKAFQTDRVRCFDFWRWKIRRPYRAAINDKLRDAAAKAEKKGIVLLLENEAACNTATGARLPGSERGASLQLSHAELGSGQRPLRPARFRIRMATIFCPRNASATATAKTPSKKARSTTGRRWAAAIIDWAGQFKAFKRDGYRFAVSLETHWNGGGTPENVRARVGPE
jgi:L-ribulose-5-phosphate 3-epimerase